MEAKEIQAIKVFLSAEKARLEHHLSHGVSGSEALELSDKIRYLEFLIKKADNMRT
jgi:hypothetical protein